VTTRVRVRQPSSRVRRRLTWAYFGGAVVELNSGQSSIADLGAAFTATQLVDSTLVRLRGELMIAGASSLPTNPVIWAAGITLATAEQVSTGITALPNPEIDDADWLWHSGGYLMSVRTNSGSEIDWLPRYIVIDNKSMRKLHGQEKRPVMIFQNSGGSGGNVVQGISVRMLIMR